jgi:hypothetical protein
LNIAAPRRLPSARVSVTSEPGASAFAASFISISLE